MPQVVTSNTILLSLALKPSQCCGFIEMNIGAGVDAGEGGGGRKSGGGNSKGGALRGNCGETIGMGVEVGIRVVGKNRDGV